MKVVFHKDLGGELAVVDVKIEDSKLKISAELSLEKGVDDIAQAIPGESAIEAMIVGLIKSGIKAL